MVYLGYATTHSIYSCRNVSIILEDGQIWEIPNVLHVLNPKKKLLFAKQLNHAGDKC
jgi:hypothetical protein